MTTRTTLSGRHWSQRMTELDAFLALLRDEGVRSYLEVGARHGDTFYAVVSSLPRGSTGTAVDMPGGAWGRADSRPALEYAVAVLEAEGYRARAIFGDSGSLAVREAALRAGPYDAVFIDGDHRLEAVTRDWTVYGPMARIVAFHDVAGRGVVARRSGMEVQVPALWDELKKRYRHVELVEPGSRMGIGVLWRED